MKDLLTTLARDIQRCASSDGLHASPVNGVCCVKYSKTDRRTKRHWRACLAIVAQGSKEVVLGREVFRCSAGDYTATPIQLPVISKVTTITVDNPFLALLIDLEPVLLNKIASQLVPLN